MGTGTRLTVAPRVGTTTSTLVGKGIYPVPLAARLTRVSQRRIRCWLKRVPAEGGTKRTPVWEGEHQPIASKIVLGFLDLQEVRFVQAFLSIGLSWKEIRAAHDKARRRYETEHPFCTRTFVTDGKHILEEVQTGARSAAYEEIARSQSVFADVVRPFIKDLDFSEDQRFARWWPLGKERKVVLDPDRSFGQPIISERGVPTQVLYRAIKAGDSQRDVADWYEVKESDVRDAIDFEEWLLAA